MLCLNLCCPGDQQHQHAHADLEGSEMRDAGMGWGCSGGVESRRGRGGQTCLVQSDWMGFERAKGVNVMLMVSPVFSCWAIVMCGRRHSQG